MSDRKQAVLLLKMARKDLKALAVMTDPEAVDEEIFGFHVQQAAEKALKAWIALQGLEYPLTHNLNILLNILEDENQPVERFRALARYTSYAVQLRYEYYDEVDELLDREEAIRKATALVENVESLIK